MPVIIHRGTPPEERPIQASCNHCGTVFTFQRHEAKVTYDQRDGDFYTIPCPVCSHTVYNSFSRYDGPG